MNEKAILLSTPEYVAALREAAYLLRWWPANKDLNGFEPSINADRSTLTATKLLKLLEWLDVPTPDLIDDERLRRRILKREAKRRHAARSRGLDIPKRPVGWKSKGFWTFVDKTDGCWNWTGTLRRGYGGYKHKGKNIGAHVWSWQEATGRVVPRGMVIMHICDNRACVRPDHLQLGTHAENAADKVRKGRQPEWKPNTSTKLQVDDVRRIRLLNPDTPLARARVAAQFGVSIATIHNILNRQTWKHIEARG